MTWEGCVHELEVQRVERELTKTWHDVLRSHPELKQYETLVFKAAGEYFKGDLWQTARYYLKNMPKPQPHMEIDLGHGVDIQGGKGWVGTVIGCDLYVDDSIPHGQMLYCGENNYRKLGVGFHCSPGRYRFDQFIKLKTKSQAYGHTEERTPVGTVHVHKYLEDPPLVGDVLFNREDLYYERVVKVTTSTTKKKGTVVQITVEDLAPQKWGAEFRGKYEVVTQQEQPDLRMHPLTVHDHNEINSLVDYRVQKRMREHLDFTGETIEKLVTRELNYRSTRRRVGNWLYNHPATVYFVLVGCLLSLLVFAAVVD